MAPYEALFAFLVVMGVISIPLAAIITRSRSPIGQAIAERIRRKTERKLGKAGVDQPGLAATGEPGETGRAGGAGAPGDGVSHDAPPGKDPYELIARQQESLHEMSNRLEFLERLLEREEHAHGPGESKDR